MITCHAISQHFEVSAISTKNMLLQMEMQSITCCFHREKGRAPKLEAHTFSGEGVLDLCPSFLRARFGGGEVFDARFLEVSAAGATGESLSPCTKHPTRLSPPSTRHYVHPSACLLMSICGQHTDCREEKIPE